MVLKRIGVGSAAKLAGGIYGGLGLLAGGILAVMSLLGAGLTQLAGDADPIPAWFGALFGIGAVLFLPLLYGVLGFVVGALSATLYNIFAGWVGGLQMELESSDLPRV